MNLKEIGREALDRIHLAQDILGSIKNWRAFDLLTDYASHQGQGTIKGSIC
jgi:hypothetical protein